MPKFFTYLRTEYSPRSQIGIKKHSSDFVKSARYDLLICGFAGPGQGGRENCLAAVGFRGFGLACSHIFSAITAYQPSL
jgi:hypothetical protein